MVRHTVQWYDSGTAYRTVVRYSGTAYRTVVRYSGKAYRTVVRYSGTAYRTVVQYQRKTSDNNISEVILLYIIAEEDLVGKATVHVFIEDLYVSDGTAGKGRIRSI